MTRNASPINGLLRCLSAVDFHGFPRCQVKSSSYHQSRLGSCLLKGRSHQESQHWLSRTSSNIIIIIIIIIIMTIVYSCAHHHQWSSFTIIFCQKTASTTSSDISGLVLQYGPEFLQGLVILRRPVQHQTIHRFVTLAKRFVRELWPGDLHVFSQSFLKLERIYFYVWYL